MSKVVIAYVAILRFGSEMRFSMSTLHAATLAGYVTANALSVRMAANLRVGLGEERNNCNWAIERVSCGAVTPRIWQIARAAS